MKERIGLDFFTKVFYPSSLKADGDTLYFIGKRTNMDRNAYDSDLYKLVDGQPYALTASHDISTYDVLRDGIVFPALRTDKDKEAAKKGEPLTVYQLLPHAGGEAREYLRLPYAVQKAKWLPDGRLLFTAVLDHTLNNFLTEYSGDVEKALKDKREQDEALTVIDELPFWFNGAGFTNKKRTALYLYDGKDTRLLSDPQANVEEPVLNGDGTKALFTQQVYEHVAPMTNKLMCLDIETGEISPVKGVAKGYIDGYAFGPDESSAILVMTPEDAPHGMIAGNPQLCSVGIARGKMKVLDSSGLYNYYNAVGSDVRLGAKDTPLTVLGGRVYFVSTIGHDTQLMAYDLAEGRMQPVTKDRGAVEAFAPYGDGFAVLAMRGLGLTDLYSVSLDGAEKKLSDLNGALLEACEVVTPIEMSFTNAQGDVVTGWVMPPVEYVPGMVYPAILDIHGGPKTAYGSVFFHEMQYWCAQGFAVLYCNPTGSDGKGDAFADIRGRYGTVDYQDIMQFVDEAQARFGFISTVRMGVTGGSYGGFMTNWIIGHTDRFRAAASQRSISNWLGFNNTSDIGYNFGQDQMQGTPWNAADKLWEASPLKYADKVKTPTLFIHSEEDYRCNMFEGIQMYYALRSFGVETRLCLFKGENHELSRSGKPKNRMRRLQEITRWMEKNLR